MVDDVYFFLIFFLFFLSFKSVVAVEVCCPGDVVSCSCCVCVFVYVVGRCVVFTVAHIEICDVIPLFYVFGSSSLALYPCEFHVQACKMHHQHPFVSWQMFQQRELHIVWQPTIKTTIKISIKIDNIINKSYISRLIHINCPRLQITFVTHQHHRHFFSIFNALYLFTICSFNTKTITLIWFTFIINFVTYLYLRNFWHYLQQILIEILHRFAYTDLAWQSIPLDQLYLRCLINMFHHLYIIK